MRDPEVVRWLWISIVLSIALTVALNVGLRLFPRAADRLRRAIESLASPPEPTADSTSRRVQVYVPWKAMLVASLVLTIVLNVVLWLT